jgi:hypothetical protein
MRAYVVTTGVLFALLALVHLWRMLEERASLATDPWFLIITLIAAGLSLWAWRVLRVSAGSSRASGEP